MHTSGENGVTDKQIDRLVYKLYELSNEEIRMVEDATESLRIPDAGHLDSS